MPDTYTDGRQRVTARQWLPGRVLAAVITDFGPESKHDPKAYGWLRTVNRYGEWSYYRVRAWDWVVYFPDGRPPIRVEEKTFYRMFKPVN